MQLWIILILWWLSIAANGCLIFRLASQRLLRRYPLFALMTAYQLALSALLMVVNVRRHSPFTEIWNASQWIGGAIQVAVVAEIFWALANFLRDRRFARRLLCLLAIFACAASLAVARFGGRWSAAYRTSLLVSEHAGIALLCVSFLSLAFIRHAGVRIPRNLRVHVLALSVWFGSSFLADFLMDAAAGRAGFAANFLIVGGQLAAFVLWTTQLHRAGETVPEQPAPRMTAAEFAQFDAEVQQSDRELRRLSSSLLRKTVGKKAQRTRS